MYVFNEIFLNLYNLLSINHMLVDPNLLEKLNTKDSVLDDRLKTIYVTSKDSFVSLKSAVRQLQY